MTLQKTHSALVVFLLVLAGCVFSLSASADIDITSGTSTIDHVQTDQDTFFGFGQLAGGTTGFDSVGWSYRAGASHNICQINVLVDASSVNVTDALYFDIRLASSTNLSTTNPKTAGVSVGQSIHYQVRNTSFTEVKTFNFEPCVIVVGANIYNIVLRRDGAGHNTNYYEILYGSPKEDFGTGQFGHWEFDLDTGQVLFTSTVSAIWWDIALLGSENFSAVTPVNEQQTNCSPPTSILDVGGGIVYAFCYLFIPSNNSFTQFRSIPDFIFAKYPFSYIPAADALFTEMTATSSVSDIIVASSTPSSAVATSSFASIDISSIVDSFPIISSFRSVLSALIYLGWVVMIIKIIPSFIA